VGRGGLCAEERGGARGFLQQEGGSKEHIKRLSGEESRSCGEQRKRKEIEACDHEARTTFFCEGEDKSGSGRGKGNKKKGCLYTKRTVLGKL